MHMLRYLILLPLLIAATVSVALKVSDDALARDEAEFAEEVRSLKSELQRAVAPYNDAAENLARATAADSEPVHAWRQELTRLEWRKRFSRILGAGIAEFTAEGPVMLHWQSRAFPPNTPPDEAVIEPSRLAALIPAVPMQTLALEGGAAVPQAPEGTVLWVTPSPNSGSGMLSIVWLDAQQLLQQPFHVLVTGRLKVAATRRDHETADARFLAECSLEVKGYVWRLWVQPGEAFPWRSRPNPAWMVGGAGFALGGLLIAFIGTDQRRRMQLEALNQSLEKRVTERTADLAAAKVQLEAAFEREQELSQMKSRFLRTVCHELRTPLAIVDSSAQILERYGGRLEETRAQECCSRIRTAVKRLAEISDEVVLFDRQESGQLPPQPVEICWREWLQGLADEVSRSHGDHPFEIQHTREAGAELKADPRLLRRMIANLLDNAMKYSPNKKSIKIRSRLNDSVLTVSICDEGMGIPENEQTRLFSTFFRASNVGHLPGLGLGLVIVRHCAEVCGGQLSVHSEEGKGTEVTLQLPNYVTELAHGQPPSH
jgi:signal transduction histidine kinase